MRKLWVLIADSSRAEIVEVEALGKKVSKRHSLKHDKSRAKNQAIDTDRPGRTFDRVGGHKHAMSSEVDAHRHEQEVFAHELMHKMGEALNGREFEEFAIVAPPRFLGKLNGAMSKQLKKALLKTVNHDIAGIADEKKRYDLMCEYLDLWNH